jgi:hypothetical protein
MRALIAFSILLSLSWPIQSCSSSKNKSSDSPSTEGETDPGTETTIPDAVDDSNVMIASSTASPVTRNATHSDPYYFAPFPFSTSLLFTYAPSGLSATTSFVSRQRYLLKSSLGRYLNIGNAGALSSSTTLTTFGDTLSKVFQVVADSNQSTWFRIDSELHGIYALDADSSGNLLFSNNRGNAASPTGRGYVVFAYDATTKLLQAKARYSYDLSTYTHSSTADASFPAQGYYVKDNGSTFVLVAASGDATQITLENSPFDVSMPGDFNPDSISYQPNPPVAIKPYVANTQADVEGTNGKVQKDMESTYLPQVAAVGDDSSTAAAASSMLDTIETALKAEGSKLRYSKKLYLAFRKAALNTILKSDNVANGTLDMHTVPYVYFTNATDTAGVHHPFMVIASYSLSDKPNRLQDVARPPGDGTTGGYATQNVTRDATLQLYLVKIPLRDYGLVSELTDNTLSRTLNSDEGSKVANSVYNYASTAAIGVAVDGVVIYPVLNNTLTTAHAVAEITSNGIHVGQGMGLHYHADGHTARSNDLSLYNIHDYDGQSHPPVIGFGLDGVALFGTYESLYTGMEGYSTGLDSYGGHTHGELGYHYHAHQYAAKSPKGQSYTVHALLKGAWRGMINSIPEFWDTNKNEPAYSLAQRTRYVGKR